MAKMGRYCKAYPIGRLSEFSGWSENKQSAAKEKHQIDGKEVEVTEELNDSDFLYLQEHFVVTDGVFMDERIIFDHVTPEWIDFCKKNLKFEVPVYDPSPSRS